jgi:hypothetical protein
MSPGGKMGLAVHAGEQRARFAGCVKSQEPDPEKKESNKLESKAD